MKNVDLGSILQKIEIGDVCGEESPQANLFNPGTG
jgi:hypothetical protein